MRTLVVFGDSNSYGTPGMPGQTFWGRFGPQERWPGVLQSALGNEWRVIEEALPGRTTVHEDPIEGRYKSGLLALPIVLESHRPIDLIVIMLGTNDLKTRFSLTAEDIAAGIRVLVQTVLASVAGPDGRPPAVLVLAPPAIEEAGWLGAHFRGGAETSRRLGACYEAVASRLGVAFLDLAPLASVDLTDGVHLPLAAHHDIGTAVAAVVKTRFP